MNCIEKMYKEIEEIKRKEELENIQRVMPIKEIKHDITFDDKDIVTIKKFDVLSSVVLEGEGWQEKRFSEEKAKQFTSFVLKKYIIFNADPQDKEDAFNYANKINEKFKDLTDIIDFYKESVSGLVDLIGEKEETETFFKNPYNCLFKDEKGYYAVIFKGKYSDVKKPLGYPQNQLKKIIKEIFEEYATDFKHKFSSDKEFNSFINSLKAYVNKADLSKPLELQDYLEVQLYGVLGEHGERKEDFINYLDKKGLRLILQGNFYYHKKPYETYGEYKKIEFRYW